MVGWSGRSIDPVETDRSNELTRSAGDPVLLDSWTAEVGEPTTVAALLHDLDRHARPIRLRTTDAAVALRWDDTDARTGSWYPQGISTSADAHATQTGGRQVVAVSWYAPRVHGHTEGVRVTFLDVTDPDDARYRHVLLVEPTRDGRTGEVAGRPVPVHAGGICWYGDLLYVAATWGGLRVFALSDLVRADPAHGSGHRYLLPQRWTYRPTEDSATPMRYSFVDLDRTSARHRLLAGEYGRGATPKQLVGFALDRHTGHLAGDRSTARPTQAFGLDVPRMQGVTVADGTYFVTSSRGRHLRGDLWVGGPRDGFRQHRCALPAGPEDISYWPSRQELWSLTEWPGRRFVLALRADDWTA